jgi:TetR/AcrR family transcriptional regulator, transcriptional repressor for nem operon
MRRVPRPRGFDAERAVDSAMELFWTKGYEATSLSDLTIGLGMHPGSLYRAFGDKHALFLRALERYHQTQAGPLAPALLAGGPVLPRIRGVLVGLVEIAAKEAEPRGCLMTNTVGELLPADKAAGKAVGEALADVESAFLQGLRLAEKQGEIPAGLDLAAWAAALTMLVQGLQVVVKADSDPRRLARSVDAVLELLAGGPACSPS